MESQLSYNEVETVHAIHRLIESRNSKVHGTDDDDEHQLLVNLLSQLESMKSEGKLKQSESQLGEVKEVPACAVTELGTKNDPSSEAAAGATGYRPEEIMKEIKEVRRQNRTTHWLLSALIFLTVAFQLSEISMVMKFKNGLTHPFRSVGSVLTGMFKRSTKNGMDILESPSTSDKDNHSEGRSITPKLPALPHVELELPFMELPGKVLKGGEE